jgi:TolA-binding protein
MLLLAIGGLAQAGGGASAELQLGYTLAHQRAQLAEAGLEDLEGRFEALEDLLRQQGIGDPDGLRSMEQLAAEMRGLQGLIEELEFSMRDMRADLDQYLVDQERRQLHDEARLSQIEALLAVQAPPPPNLDVESDPDRNDASPASLVAESSPSQAGEDTSASAVPEDSAGRLDAAKERMREGQQAVARVILTGALEQQTDDALAPELQYRLAETWFNEKKYREAARAFQIVTDRHARSPWASWSMLRIGECFAGMGRADAAKTFYEGVVRNFPSSEAAREAKQHLTD